MKIVSHIQLCTEYDNTCMHQHIHTHTRMLTCTHARTRTHTHTHTHTQTGQDMWRGYWHMSELFRQLVFGDADWPLRALLKVAAQHQNALIQLHKLLSLKHTAQVNSPWHTHRPALSSEQPTTHTHTGQHYQDWCCGSCVFRVCRISSSFWRAKLPPCDEEVATMAKCTCLN